MSEEEDATIFHLISNSTRNCIIQETEKLKKMNIEPWTLEQGPENVASLEILKREGEF